MNTWDITQGDWRLFNLMLALVGTACTLPLLDQVVRLVSGKPLVFTAIAHS
ncbi:MAG: hypothetical protein Q4D79_04785 [Propionibacteriaceae bacterium]|nr:hypothetical protein [Propionibacteriaceae bacterium]